MISTMTVVIIMSIVLIWLLIASNSSNKKEEKKKKGSKYKIEVSENGNWYIYRPMSLDYKWCYIYFTKVPLTTVKREQVEFDNEKDAVCFINNLIREDREFKEKEQKLKDMTIYIDD